MYLALAQTSQQGFSLGTGLFLIGILGLIFALRRTLVRARRQRLAGGDDNIEVIQARRNLIDKIDLDNHHRKQRGAVRFNRYDRELSAGQREYLMRIDKWQSQHRGGGTDG